MAGTPGFPTVVLRTVSGRCVVIWQNGMETYGPLSSDTAFVQAALRGWFFGTTGRMGVEMRLRMVAVTASPRELPTR